MSVKADDPNPTQLGFVSTAKTQQLEQKITQITEEVAATKSCACSSTGTKAHTSIEPVASQSIAAEGPGKGKSQDPYKIASIQDLQKLRSIWKNNRGKYFIVTQNIDLSSIANFAPLPSFEGILDGNNKTILNLKIDGIRWIDSPYLSSQRNIGLFETIERTGQVKNLRLENVLVMGAQNVGGLAGNHSGRIDNSSVTGQVLGTDYTVGGLVGSSGSGSRITDSFATANVFGYYYVGGLVGLLHEGIIQRCYSTGTVFGIGSATNRAEVIGGLVGSSGSDSRITDSYATGKVSGHYYVGGLVGKLFEGTIQSCYATGTVSGIGNTSSTAGQIGGLVGGHYGTIQSSYATGDVSGQSYVGGLVGLSGSGHQTLYIKINNSYATGNVSGQSYVGGLVGLSGSGHQTLHIHINNSYATGNVSGTEIIGGLVGDNRGTITKCYAIGQASGKDRVGGLVGWNTGWIDNSYVTGQVLGTKGYVGGLAGKSYTGSKITYSHATAKVYGHFYVGGLVGELYQGTIQSCYATGTVLGIGNATNRADKIGGLVGSSSDSRITDSHATGKVSGYYYVGGLVGDFYKGTIQMCYATGTVSGIGNTSSTANQIGGLVGNNYGTILSSYATGDVSGRYYIGGLVGLSSSGHHINIKNSYATGNVSGTGITGGLVGDNRGTITKCYAIGQVSGRDRLGGLVGDNDGYIDNSYATGQVLGTDYGVGGLVGSSGRDSRITDSYATAKVSGRSSVGGLVGDLYEGTIQRCYATGTVSGIGSTIGGLVGDHSGTILSSYATGDVSGPSYIGGLVGFSSSGDDIKINNSYATGNVSGSWIIGGLVGENRGTITTCYAIGQLSGKRDRVGGLVGENTGRIEDSYGKQQFGTTNTLGAKTDTELKNPSTFIGWDTRLWKLTQNQFPKLKRLLN